MSTNGVKEVVVDDREENYPVDHPRRLIPELCRHFYKQGWFSGTGGGISIKRGDEIYIAPSGVQKERLIPSDLFVLSPEGVTLTEPVKVKQLTLSQCTPLFMNAYTDRKAGAVMHSHGAEIVLASLIKPTEKDIRIRNLEMLKGVYNPVEKRMFRYDEEVVIPVIENTCFEKDLKDDMLKAMRAYPTSNAVIVRRHGIYVWGDSWQQCKTMAECYHYLCKLYVKMAKYGISNDF